MTPDRFLDRARFHKGEPQQDEGLRMLYAEIAASDRASVILSESAPWALKFSEKPKVTSHYGPDEAGMVGPEIDLFKLSGWKAGCHHIVINDKTNKARIYNFHNQLLRTLPCLARGQFGDLVHSQRNSDTPPGLYVSGQLYDDYSTHGIRAPYSKTRLEYGYFSIDFQELENQEAKHGRGGIMAHGGGTRCGWPGAWEEYQQLFATNGCVRFHNAHLRDHIVPLLKTGKIFFSVFQEAGSK